MTKQKSPIGIDADRLESALGHNLARAKRVRSSAARTLREANVTFVELLVSKLYGDNVAAIVRKSLEQRLEAVPLYELETLRGNSKAWTAAFGVISALPEFVEPSTTILKVAAAKHKASIAELRARKAKP